MRTVWVLSRHYLFHILFAIVVWLVLKSVGVSLNFSVFILGSLLIDLDHVVNLLNPNDPVTKKVAAALSNFKFSEKKVEGAVDVLENQGFTHLYFHNFGALLVVVGILIFVKQAMVFSFFGGFMIHQIFDICCDYYRWGNVNHWMGKD